MLPIDGKRRKTTVMMKGNEQRSHKESRLYHCVPSARVHSSRGWKKGWSLLTWSCSAASPTLPQDWVERDRNEEGANHRNHRKHLLFISTNADLLTSWVSLLFRVREESSCPSKEQTCACLVWSSWDRRCLADTAAWVCSWTLWSSLSKAWSSTRDRSY